MFKYIKKKKINGIHLCIHTYFFVCATTNTDSETIKIILFLPYVLELKLFFYGFLNIASRFLVTFSSSLIQKFTGRRTDRDLNSIISSKIEIRVIITNNQTKNCNNGLGIRSSV